MVVECGNQHMHAVTDGVTYREAEGAVEVCDDGCAGGGDWEEVAVEFFAGGSEC